MTNHDPKSDKKHTEKEKHTTHKHTNNLQTEVEKANIAKSIADIDISKTTTTLAWDSSIKKRKRKRKKKATDIVTPKTTATNEKSINNETTTNTEIASKESSPNINIKSDSNMLPGIDDIHAYIQQKKQNKTTEKQQNTLLSKDWIDLLSVENAYAVVPHAKWDHKLVFIKGKEPQNLLPDPRKREKWKMYSKKWMDIYTVEVDMYEHPTLKSTSGEALDVWVIADSEELTKQIVAIRSGQGGWDNFSDPIRIESNQVLQTENTQEETSVKESPKDSSTIVLEHTDAVPDPDQESVDEDNQEHEEAWPLDTTIQEAVVLPETPEAVVPLTEVTEEVKQEVAKEVAKEITEEASEKGESTPLEMNDTTSTVSLDFPDLSAESVASNTTVTTTEEVIDTSVAQQVSWIESNTPTEQTSYDAWVATPTSPSSTSEWVSLDFHEEALAGEIPALGTAPTTTSPDVVNTTTEQSTEIQLPEVNLDTLQWDSSSLDTAIQQETVTTATSDPIAINIAQDSITPLTQETVDASFFHTAEEPTIEANTGYDTAPSGMFSHSNDPVQRREEIPENTTVELENTTEHDTLSITSPMSETTATATSVETQENSVVNLDILVEESTTTPSVESSTNTTTINQSINTPISQHTTTSVLEEKTKPNNKKMLGWIVRGVFLIIIIAMFILMFKVMFPSIGAEKKPSSSATNTGTIDSIAVDTGNTLNTGDNWAIEPTPNPDIIPNPNPIPTENPTPIPSPETNPTPTPEPTENPTNATLTLPELQAKIEVQQTEARKVLNIAKLLENKAAIKFSMAAMLKAGNVLERIKTESSVTADEIAAESASIDRYLQEANKLVE